MSDRDLVAMMAERWAEVLRATSYPCDALLVDGFDIEGPRTAACGAVMAFLLSTIH